MVGGGGELRIGSQDDEDEWTEFDVCSLWYAGDERECSRE